MSFGLGSIPDYLRQIRKNKERTQSRSYHAQMEKQGMVQSKEVPTYARFTKEEKAAFDLKIQENKSKASKQLRKSIFFTIIIAIFAVWSIQKIILWAFF